MAGYETDQVRRKLTELSRYFHKKGWALATSGNYSARIHKDRVVITASGKNKAVLTKKDLIVVDLQGNRIHSRDAAPSAETPLHCELYRRISGTRAVAHVHSKYSTLLSLLYADQRKILLSGYEMLKALEHVVTHDHTETVPIVANSQDMSVLCKSVRKELEENPSVHSFLIAGHGLYTWGKEIEDLKRNVEAFEFLFECEYHRLLV
jgi:methylthioribulose-1-phosphate dehydratase